MIKSQTKGARIGFAALAAGLLLAAAAPVGAQTGLATGMPSQDGPGEALSRHLRSLAENPRSLAALMGAGKAALQLGDPQAAITFFGRAEEQAPGDGRVKMWIGAALVQLQQPQGALKFFAEASSMGVPEAELAGERGLAFDLTGDPRRAQRDYRLALQRGADPEITRRLALSLAISGEREPALQLLEGQLLTRDRAAERSRAFILAMTGDAAGAVRSVQTSMPNGQGSALAPFLERMHALGPSERALAVHLGHFPQNWRNLPVARPADSFASVASAVRAGTPAAARPAPARRSPPTAAAPEPRRQPAAPVTAAAKPAPQPARKAPAEPRREPAESRSQWAWSGRTGETRTTRPRTETAKPAEPRGQVAAALPAVRRPAPAQSAPQAGAAAQAAPVPAPPVQAPSRQVAIASTPLPGLGQPAAQPPREEPAVAAAPPPASTPPAAEAPVRIAEAQPVLSAPGFSIAGSAPVETAAAAPPPTATAPDPAPAENLRGSRLADVAATVASLPEVVLPAASAASTAATRAAPPPAAKASTPPARTAAKAPAPAAKAPAPAAKKPAAPAEPSRHWVQIAGGADKATFPREFARLKAKAPRLSAHTAWTTPLKATNRLLVGPFKSAGEAQAFVNELAKADLSAFAWTSEAGQKIDKLPAR